MPIYEYLCHSCGKKFDVRQKFADEPLKVHEECGGEAERLLSVPALQFKGSGWYVNDYAKGGTSRPSDTKTESKSDQAKSGSGESKTESKSETKTTSTESKSTPGSAPAGDSK